MCLVSCLSILNKFILFRLQNSHSFSGPRDKTYLAIHYSDHSLSLCGNKKKARAISISKFSIWKTIGLLPLIYYHTAKQKKSVVHVIAGGEARGEGRLLTSTQRYFREKRTVPISGGQHSSDGTPFQALLL